jgi:hypothetical protein
MLNFFGITRIRVCSSVTNVTLIAGEVLITFFDNFYHDDEVLCCHCLDFFATELIFL